MKFFNKKICLLAILLLVPLMMSAQSRLAIKSPIVAKKMVIVKLESNAKHYRGVCPVIVKMTGKITTPSSMRVSYSFLRSDGSRPQWNSLNFPGAGTKVLPFTWKISKDYNGWVQLIVKTENDERRSEKFHFDVVCDNVNKTGQADMKIKKIKKPDLIVSGIEIWSHPVKTGEATKIAIGVKNIDNRKLRKSPPCNLAVRLFNDTHQLMLYELYPIPAIPSGVIQFVFIPYTFSQQGNWRIEAWADAKKEVSEIDETNNIKSLNFYVE